ncbi:hypothetical protein CS379_06225 [Methylobacterium frigidaeris]|uniref:Uncharacterized protein n=1 Tax=Methylobacterium frigidaeris TaxID=2038277 RepID=A0AA37M8L0_9HYPH|nr:hypothetical protein CS379_06225 [Methylobacterium frigidaeris]GJD66249.1 hypothetical protein MPEAHAMD_6446 [Methylobacterium frigidaeris]
MMQARSPRDAATASWRSRFQAEMSPLLRAVRALWLAISVGYRPIDGMRSTARAIASGVAAARAGASCAARSALQTCVTWLMASRMVGFAPSADFSSG